MMCKQIRLLPHHNNVRTTTVVVVVVHTHHSILKNDRTRTVSAHLRAQSSMSAMSMGAGEVAVRVRKIRQCAGVDNNHTKMLCAVTA